MNKNIILYALCILGPAFPLVTKYLLLNKLPAWKNLPREKKTRIHKLSFIGTVVCIILFLLIDTLVD